MANITWANQKLCTVADVKDRITDLNVPLNFSSNTDKSVTLEDVVKTKIKLAKTFIYNDLALEMKSLIPETVDKWLQYKRFQVDNTKQAIQRDLQQISQVAGLPVGAFMELGTIFDLYFWLFSSGMNTHPRTLSNFGTPTDGTFGVGAGFSQIGDMCVDTNNWFIYINISTDINSPRWTKLIATNAMDNLLNVGYDSNNNPGVFMTVAVDYTLWLMAEDGSLRDRTGLDQTPFFIDLTKAYKKKADESFKKYFNLIQIDIDGDGIVSDYERSLNTKNPWIMA